MKFYPFVQWIVNNRIRNGSLVGINPFGDEWKQLFEHLANKNVHGAFGDYGSYDKTLYVTWQKSIMVLYRMFYGVNHPELRIMDLLVEEMISSYHVVNVNGKGFLYKWDWGNTSGNFLTSIINGVANYCLIAFAATSIKLGGLENIRRAKSCDLEFLGPLLKRIAVAIYGDDNAVVPDVDNEDINTLTIQAALAEIGIEYTDELKGLQGVAVALKSLMDGSIIGRKFLVDASTYPTCVDPPLRSYSILESLLWDKTGKETPDITASKCKMAAGELSYHGEDKFNTFYPIIRHACELNGIDAPEFTCHKDALNYMRSLSLSMYCEY
jgi:hypothetical protein